LRMLGLMQDWPLLCHKIIEHAAKSDDAAAPESAAETKPQPTKKRRQSRRF